MHSEFVCYVTKVGQTAGATEDALGDVAVPHVTDGDVVVTAQASEAYVVFAASVDERLTIGDEVLLRLDTAKKMNGR